VHLIQLFHQITTHATTRQKWRQRVCFLEERKRSEIPSNKMTICISLRLCWNSYVPVLFLYPYILVKQVKKPVMKKVRLILQFRDQMDSSAPSLRVVLHSTWPTSFNIYLRLEFFAWCCWSLPNCKLL
jgi:hypothetical protein